MRVLGLTKEDARELIEEFCAGAGIRIEPVPAATFALAMEAWRKFGKGNHPAGLNFGDCFAYACARHLAMPLLYKGRDFALTDIEAS
jgi:ribonuclease VapC